VGVSPWPEAAASATSETRQTKKFVFETLTQLKPNKDIFRTSTFWNGDSFLPDESRSVNLIFIFEAQIARTRLAERR
jgi:hypothetical protein